MPVKNKNRQSNSGYEGVITGLNDEEKKVLEDAGIGGGGGMSTANVNSETYQLDTSSLTTKDQYVLASADDGAGSIRYIPLQTYFFNDGYFNKEVKMQTTSSDFRLSLSDLSFQSYNNYALNAKITNVDFTSSLDSTNTWTKLGDIKYIAIEEKNALTEESSHKYLEISGGGSSILKKDGTFVGSYEGVVANTISLSSAEYNRIKNGEINIIYGEYKLEANVVSNYKVVFDYINNGDMYNYAYSDVIIEDNRMLIFNYQLTITAQDATLAIMKITQPRIPTLPTDASSKTYTLKAVNGVLTWVE